MNWRGRPLTSHQVVLQSIAATTTRTGLAVHAELDTTRYPLGVTISKAPLAALPLQRHEWHGDWNYTLHPTPPRPAPPPAPAPAPARRPAPHHRPPATSAPASAPAGTGTGTGPPRTTARRPRPPRPADLDWLACPTLTGVPTTSWDALVTIMTTLDNDQPRPDHRSDLLLPITARLTATLVNIIPRQPPRHTRVIH
jgi:Rhodopirellula transposase DDE domain